MKEKIKVLVVDDDRRMVKTICDILKVKGYEALQAYTGEEAVEKVKSQKPDCALMDIKMPGINGVKALELINNILPNFPVALMSAYATEELVAEAKQQGACLVLTKPVDIEMILSFLDLLRKEKSILVVDDDPVFCKTLMDILHLRGYRVETEADPEKVLMHIEMDYKLVVVLDLKLGNTDGLEVLKAIRAKYPSKPVVLVTGYREEKADSIRKGLHLGAYACLYKPFETEALLETIKEITYRKIQEVISKQFWGNEI